MAFNKTTLKNGLRILTVPLKGLTAAVLVLVEAGSEYETKETNGLSHFLEHMCFKGTKKRPKAINIVSELDGIGASYNAFTSNEITGYYAKAEARHLDKVLDVVSDLYINPVFNTAEIDRERGVIIEEINMYEDLPMRKVQDLFTDLLYGDQPAGWDIAGKKEVVKKLNQENLLKYRDARYVAHNTLVVVAGDFNEKEIIEKIKKCFADVKEGKKITKSKTIENQDAPKLLVKQKNSDQTHIVLGVRAFDIFNEKKYALEVLSDILGGGMSSRLFQKIREEMGAVYYVKSDTDLSTDHGYLSALAGVATERLVETVLAILQEFKRLKTEVVSTEELERAKDHLIGNVMISLETSDELARFYGGQEIITGSILSPKEFERKIRAVKAEEVQSLAESIFQNQKLNLAVIGPVKERKPLQEILTLE